MNSDEVARMTARNTLEHLAQLTTRSCEELNSSVETVKADAISSISAINSSFSVFCGDLAQRPELFNAQLQDGKLHGLIAGSYCSYEQCTDAHLYDAK